MRTRLWGAVGLLFLFPLEVLAQDPLQAHPGDRIRVSAPACDFNKAKGLLSSLGEDRLIGVFDGREAYCPSEALTALDVSVGRRHWWVGLFTGTLIGAGAGLVVGGIMYANEPRGEDNLRVILLLLGPPIGASAGLVVGTAVGVLRGTDSWMPVPLPPVRPSLLGPRSSPVDFGLSIPIRF